MQAANSFYAFSNATETGESEFIGNTQGDLLTVEVQGTATGISLSVLGLVDFKQEEYTALSGISAVEFNIINTIAEKGVYYFPITGLSRIKLKLNAVAGGTVTVYCRTSKEG